VVQPFGKAMVAAGLNASSNQSELDAALVKLQTDKTDSNSDGVTDYDSLATNIDPNPPLAPIQYGCGGQIASHHPYGWQASLLGLITFAVFFGRRPKRL
jgi:hypothetical protein